MKLLLDQNLSRHLLADLGEVFPGSSHVEFAGLAEAADEDVWRYAASGGYVIVSKDTDFVNRALLLGHPPKVICLKVGNCATRQIRELLLSNLEVIRGFVIDPVESLLMVQK